MDEKPTPNETALRLLREAETMFSGHPTFSTSVIAASYATAVELFFQNQPELIHALHASARILADVYYGNENVNDFPQEEVEPFNPGLN